MLQVSLQDITPGPHAPTYGVGHLTSTARYHMQPRAISDVLRKPHRTANGMFDLYRIGRELLRRYFILRSLIAPSSRKASVTAV